MEMQNTTHKIVYSLRVHLKLQELGYKCLLTMPNPQNPGLNCWVYERTPAFLEALKSIIGGA